MELRLKERKRRWLRAFLRVMFFMVVAANGPGALSAATLPASCMIGAVQESVVLIIFEIAPTTRGDDTAKPSRHPPMLYDLLKV